MELSQAVLDGLALAGDAAHVPDKCFPVIVTRALDGLLDEKHRHMIAKDPSFKSLDQAILKEAFSALVTLVAEATKNDMDPSSIRNIYHFSPILEDCKYTKERIDTFNRVYSWVCIKAKASQRFFRGGSYKSKKPLLQILLSSVGTSPPHIVDVDWRLDYYIKNNHLERVNEAVYLISLKTEVAGSADLQEVQFSCTQEQLQDLVGKLKDASKCLEKTSQF